MRNQNQSRSTQNNPLFISAKHGNLLDEPLLILVKEHWLICDISESAAFKFFGENKSELLNRSLIELLINKNLDVKELLAGIKASERLFSYQAKLHQADTHSTYDVTIVHLRFDPEPYFLVLIDPCSHESYGNLQAYITTIVNNLPGAVYWKDRNGAYMGCNQFVAQMAGFNSSRDMIGKTDYDLCWKEFADDWHHMDQEVMKKEKTLIREERAKLADGRIITELTFKTPLRDSQGTIMGVIGTSLDITDKKVLEEQLIQAKEKAEAANHAKTEFIRNIEHDIRTPFSGVYSMAHFLVDEIKEEQANAMIRAIADCATELLNYCNSAIEFSRLESGALPLVDKKMDLKNLAERVLAMEKPAALSKNLEIYFDYDPDLPRLFISDEQRIQRILINLLGNAIKFTKQGHIKLSIQKLKEIKDRHCVVQLIVEDTGIGIPDDKQAAIFEKFSRVSPSNQNYYKGAGLGLSSVRYLVQSLEGELDLESELGQGSRFICSLPMTISLLDNTI